MPRQVHPQIPGEFVIHQGRLLTPEQWTALWLFYGEGYSAKEVARAMDRASVSVRVLLYRGRKALEPYLKDHANALYERATAATTFQDDYRMSRMLAGTYHDSHIA